MISQGLGNSVDRAYLFGYGLAIIAFAVPAVLFIAFGIRWVKDKGAPRH